MSDCEHCYKKFYCSPAEHEATCTGIAHSKSLKRSSTSICSPTIRLPAHVALRGTSLNPKPTSLLNLRSLSSRYGNHPATSTTFKKRKGPSQQVIQRDVIPQDLNNSTARTRVTGRAGYNTTTLGDNESTNVLFSNPIFQNATTECRRTMLKNHMKPLSSGNVDPCLRDTNGSQVSTNFTNQTAIDVTGAHASSSHTKTNNSNEQFDSDYSDQYDLNFNVDKETDHYCSSSVSAVNGSQQRSSLFHHANNDTAEEKDVSGEEKTEMPELQDRTPTSTSVQRIIEIMEKQKEPNGVIFGPKELAALELHRILDKANCPKYLFDKIFEWGHTNDIHKTGKMSRKQLINSMKKKMQIPDIYPKRVVVAVDEDHFEVTTKFDFKSNLYSLLTDLELMRPENLLFGDKPLEPPVFEPGDDTPLDDIDSCEWYYETYKKMVKDPRLQMLCPIIIFEDETYQDTKGALKFHLICFTLGIFNRKTRAKPEAWRHLGFIPKAKNRQPEGTTVKDTTRRKCVDHHVFITEILAGFKDAQAEQPLQWKFGDTDVEMFIPLMFSIGDIAGQDKLCGRYSAHVKMQSAMRDCPVKWADADNPDHDCTFLNMHVIHDLSMKGGQNDITATREESTEIKRARTTLKLMSFHYGVNNAFKGIDFGANIYGINAATPPCISHSFKMRFSGDASAGYLDLFGVSDVTERKIIVENVIPRFIHRTYRQSSRDYPKIYNFSTKIVKGKVLTHGELLAQTFALYIFSLTSFAKSTASPATPARLHNEFSLLLERTLTVYSFLYQTSFPKILAKPTEVGKFNAMGDEQLVRYHKLYCRLLTNASHSNTRSPKQHTLFHWMSYIYRYGSTKNFEGSSCDSNFKENIKKHAARSQRRPESVHMQTGNNFCDGVVLKKAMWFAQLHNNDDVDDEDSSASSDDDAGYLGNIVTVGNFRISKRSGRFFLKRQNLAEHHKLSWDKKQVAPTGPFDHEVVRKVFSFLFNPATGVADGILKIPGFTCLKHKGNGDLFRGHPCYRSGEPWFDHVYVKWDANYKQCPARIEMFLDLSDCIFGDESELSNELYAVITSVIDSNTNPGHPTNLAKREQKLRNSTLEELKLCTFWEHERQLRFIPVRTIHSGAFVFPDFTDDTLSPNNYWIEIKPRDEWHDHHNFVAANPYVR